MTNANFASPRLTLQVLSTSFVALAATGGTAVAFHWNSRGDSCRAMIASAAFVSTMIAIHLAGYRLYRNQPIAWSPHYAAVMRKGLATQVIASVLFSTIPLAGIEKIILIAAVGFWAGVAIIFCRRPETPRHNDLQFIQWGPLLLLAITLVLIAYVPLLGR